MSTSHPERRPRVLFFVYRLGDYSGAAQQAFKLAVQLRGRAMIRIVNIQMGERRGKQLADGVEIHHVPAGRLARFFALLRLVVRKDYDIIHLHGFFTAPLLLAHLLGAKTFLKSTLLNDDDFDALRSKRFGWFRLALAKRVSLNNALTPTMYAINSKHLTEQRIVVIPNGVDAREGAPENKDFSAPLFVFVGAIVRRKRPDLAIRYFVENYASTPGAALHLIGPFSIGLAEEDEAYKSECELLAQGYEDRIRFLGRLAFEDVSACYRKAVALLFFSEREGMPNVVLEAMAHNCVPILNGLQGLATELVDNGKSGFILSSLKEGIALQEIRRVAEEGAPRAKVLKEFSLARNADENLRAYRRLLADSTS